MCILAIEGLLTNTLSFTCIGDNYAPFIYSTMAAAIT